MPKKKLNLKHIQIKSFVTEVTVKKEGIQGGAGTFIPEICEYTGVRYCWTTPRFCNTNTDPW